MNPIVLQEIQTLRKYFMKRWLRISRYLNLAKGKNNSIYNNYKYNN